MPHADALTPSLREESLPLDHLRLLEVHAAVAPPARPSRPRTYRAHASGGCELMVKPVTVLHLVFIRRACRREAVCDLVRRESHALAAG